MRKGLFFLMVFLLSSLSYINAQVIADFSANNTLGCDFAQISFSNESTDGGSNINCSNGYSYLWTFDSNGSSSTQCNPGNIYSQPGTYTVCLTVTNNNTGESNTICRDDYITIFELPTAEFTATPESGCEPLTVCFDNTSFVPVGNLVDCIWDFADGTVVNDCAAQVCHTYNQAGSFDVSLTILDDNNCPPVTVNNTVTVLGAPIIDVSGSPTFACNPPLDVTFTNSSPVLTGVTYEWVFENGSPNQFVGDNPPPITWNSNGSFDVTVIAIEETEGCRDTLVLEDYINVGSAVGFDVSSYDICLGDTVTFTDNSEAPTSWSWDFGDGVGTSINQNPSYIFTTPGCYSVTLQVENNGCLATVTDPICIQVNDNPLVTFTNDNPLGCELPHTVNFDSSTSAGVNQYSWDFGGLGTSAQSDPSFTFNEFGTHTVTLEVTSTDGCTTTISEDIIVEPITVDLLGNSVQGCAPITVTLQETSMSVVPITNWEWTIPGVGVFTEESPTITVTDTGFFDVQLEVTNALGCTATTTFPGYVQTGAPQPVDFEGTPLETCIDTAITFTHQSTEFVNEWFWDFGDGGTSTEPNPTYTYQDTGFFEVCLTVFQNGCPNTICKPDYVYLLAPRAGIDTVRTCSSPYFIDFVDNSLGADSIFWDFGVETSTTDTSSLSNPSFVYPDTGIYTVTQTVFNFTTGCLHDVTTEIYITDPLAQFTIPDTIGCVPFTITPSDNSIFATTYEWSSVNGVIDDPTSPTPNITYNTAGVYNDITLVITDPNGCTDTLVSSANIYVNEVSPGFDYSPLIGCSPLDVNFIDTSSNLLFNNVQWDWDFGDGNTASGENVMNTFSTPDTFDITLTVTDDIGCTASTVINDAIITTRPATFFELDTIACTEQTVSFTNMSVGAGLTYTWTFGDGNTSTDVSPTHFYLTEGEFEVCLTSIDVNGCDSTYCDSVLVINPVANFVADTTFAFCPPLVVTFTNLSQNGVSGEYVWDFGDNTGLSDADNPAHVYTGAGVFDVSLIATSPSGCMDTIVFEEYIELQGPIGEFSFDPDTGCVDHTVTFITNSLNPVTHIMDYGNGDIDSSSTMVSLDTFIYTYTQAGDYFPAMILVDELGCAQVFDSDSAVIVESLEIDFFATDTLLCNGGTTSFFSQISSSEPITFLEWTFEGVTPSTSTNPNPANLTYDTFGQYDVTLTVSNGVCTKTLTKSDFIDVDPVPVASFIANPDEGCEALDVNFIDQSTVTPGFISAWEWTFENGDNSFLQNPSYVYPAEGTYNVELTVTSENGCTDDTTGIITVLPTPVAQADPGGTICIGDVFQLGVNLSTDTTGVTYTWDNTGSLSCSDCPNPVANPIVTTTYTVTVTNPNNCSDTSAVTIDVLPFPVPEVNLNNDTLICEGSTIQLLANGGFTPTSYEWDTSRDGLSCYNCPNPFATPTSTTTYVVIVTGEGGCISIDSVTVDIFDPTTEFIGPDVTICEGESTVLSTGGFGSNPTWNPVSGLSCQFCPNPTANPTDTTAYTISVLDNTTGCVITDTIVVNVVPIDAIDAGEDKIACPGDPVTLDGMGFGTISWTPAALLDDATIATPMATVMDTTRFYITATQGLCELRDSVDVNVVTSAEVTAPDVEICIGETAQLNAIGLADGYSWSPSESLSSALIPDPIATVSETTTYIVTATLGSCDTDSDTLLLTVNDLPMAEVYEIYYFYAGEAVQINVDIPEDANYAFDWTPAEGLNCTDCQNPIATVDSTSTFNALVTDLDTGCESEITTQLVRLDVCSPDVLAVPNGFTPNNDGNNDILYVRSTGLSDIGIFRVFDRWGDLLFETNTLNEGWDGTHNGKPVNPGVFVYYVEGICPIDGSKLLQKGNVTLIR